MSPQGHHLPRPGPRFPRVSGDEPGQSLEATATVKFSPRERG